MGETLDESGYGAIELYGKAGPLGRFSGRCGGLRRSYGSPLRAASGLANRHDWSVASGLGSHERSFIHNM